MMFFGHVFLILSYWVVLSKLEEVDDAVSTHVDRQNKLFSILYHVHQNNITKEHKEIANSWSLEEHEADYNDSSVVTKFIHHYKNGLLSKESVFTIFYESHLEEAIALIRLLFYAKDWDTFYKTIVWARKNTNSQMFVYALYVAVDHREDCRSIVLPPIYEVNPYLFINIKDVLEAEESKERLDFSLKHPDMKNYIKVCCASHLMEEASSNVTMSTDFFKDNRIESMYRYPGGGTPLVYLYEDIGINAMYYYFNIRFPLWMSSKEFKLQPRRGEVFLHFYQQLFAKHHLERVVTGKPEDPELHFDGIVDEQYVPFLKYPNGQRLPNRKGGAVNLDTYYALHSELPGENVQIYSNTFLLDSERRIRDAIDSGFVRTRNGSDLPLYSNITEGVNLIGNVIEGNADSPNQPFYGSLVYQSRHLLGYQIRAFMDGPTVPCAIEQLESSLRDRMFWRFIKKIVDLYQRYLYHLPPYTLEELVVPGVEIEGINIEALTRNIEFFKVDLVNAVNHTENETFGDFQVHLNQMRPRADNFTYSIYVQSEASKKLCFKVFIGPSCNPRQVPVRLSQHRLHMFHLDRFTYHLQEGNNTIVRNITDSPYFTSDDRMFSDTYRDILSAKAGNTTYKMETFDLNSTYAWPLRFALPLGTPDGFPYRFYVVAFQESVDEEEPRSLLYPFDRQIKNEKMFLKVPNFYSHVAPVYYKGY